MSNIKAAISAIRQAKTIAISGHINPDGDSLGSLLSLGLALKKSGKRTYLLCLVKIPKKYFSLPGIKLIKKVINQPLDLAIAVDCSNKEILGDAWQIFNRAKKILEIDHHEFRRPFGEIGLIDHKAAAVGELIYKLIGCLKIKMSRPIAQNLLTSIIVETDSFRLPNVSAFTFRICEKLMKNKVNFYKLVDTVFWSKSKETVILSGICLARCKFLKNNRIAWSIVKQKDFLTIKGDDADVDAVADEMRAIHGVKIAVLFREKSKDTIRVSLRSKGKINIAKIAEYFGGGGHFDVAGCSIKNDRLIMDQLLKKVSLLLR